MGERSEHSEHSECRVGEWVIAPGDIPWVIAAEKSCRGEELPRRGLGVWVYDSCYFRGLL